MGPPTGAPPSGSSGGPPPRVPFWRQPKKLLIIALAALLFAAGAGSVLGYLLTFDIPEVKHLQDWKPPVVTTIYSADGQVLYQFGAEKRIVVGLDQIPKEFLEALVATEDSHFYEHFGVDPWGIARAIITDIIRFKKAQGGSTITQQLARSLFLKPEKTVRRKLQEMVLAVQIEKAFTKQEILGFYCNQVYMGHGRYGIEAAAEYYFGRPAKEMALPESALLAGLVQRPEAYSPFRAPDKARSRRDHVLNRMVEENKISRDVADPAIASPVIVAKLPEEDNIAPYFVEEVRRYLDSKYGEVMLYEEGLEVHTTLDASMQKAANQAVFEGLRTLDKRQGFRPIKENVLKDGGDLATFTHVTWTKPPSAGRLRWGVVTEVTRKAATVKLGEYTAHFGPEGIDWTQKSIPNQVLKVGDVSPFLVVSIDEPKKELKVKLDQEPLVEGALLAIDPATGEIKALVGGYDFNRSEFDRSMQSYRQAGSAFKPFVYTTALDSGNTLADTIFDEPTVFVDPATGDEYQPSNYYRKYYGVTTLREAMEESRNIVAVKLLNQVGYSRTIDTARKMGISSPLRPYPSMALGTMEVSLIDLTTAYSIFPNQGVRVEPHFIRYVADRDGTMREEAKPKVIEVLRADIAYLMTYLLEGVTESGTGALAARELFRIARTTGAGFRFESAVADCMPVFNLAEAALPVGRHLRFRGVLNSTSNHVLQAIAQGRPAEAAIGEMQRLGLAEADPSHDLDGWDQAVKVVILANVLMGRDLTPAAVERTPVAAVDPGWLQTEEGGGRTVRLVAEVGPEGPARVYPASLSRGDFLASLRGVSLGLTIETELAGTINVSCVEPHVEQTAYGMLADVVAIARGRLMIPTPLLQEDP